MTPRLYRLGFAGALAYILFSVCAPPHVLAGTAAEWRFWDSDDGLADRYAASIGRDGTGSLWVTHGDLLAISHFDGRGFTRVATPFAYTASRFDSVDGQSGWISEEDGLRYLHGKEWKIFPQFKVSALIPVPQNKSQLRVLDLGNSCVLLLFSGRIARFSALSHSLETLPLPLANSRIGPLATFERGPDGTVWVAAEKGIARFRYGVEGKGPYQWEEFPVGDLSVEAMRHPVPCLDGEVFFTAFRKGGRIGVILRFARGKWDVISDVPQSVNATYAWRDGSGDLWLSSGLLYRKRAADPRAGWSEVVSDNSALSGKVFGVVVNADGSFFLSTPFGVALHVNAAWKTIDLGAGSKGDSISLKQSMSAILEDRSRSVWILAAHTIFRLYKDRWDKYPIPQEYVIDLAQRNSLGELADGRILIRLERPPYLIAFDPQHPSHFSRIRSIDGYIPLTFCRQASGQFLVAMVSLSGGSDALAKIAPTDSLTFLGSIHAKWNVHYPRGMLETADGQVWVGGTSGLVRVANGHSQRFDWVEVPGAPTKIPVQVYSLLPDGETGVLVGGKDALLRWDGARLRWLSKSPLIIHLARDRSGTLWAGTPLDVRRLLRPRTSAMPDTGLDWISNGVIDGLPVGEGNAILPDSQGRIWAITDKGLALFQPGVDGDAPEALISADRNSSEASSSGEFRVIFTGKDKWNLTPPDALLYSFRLDRGTWSPLSASALAAFHSLPTGAHSFEVLAVDHQGNISEHPARLAFHVPAPWYRTHAFVAILAAGLLIIAALSWFSTLQVLQLHRLATHDVLTSCWNRRAIFKTLSNELRRTRRDATPLAVIMADIDKFKHINDRYGHAAGDAVLREVASRLRAALTGKEAFGRYGGEEFLIVLPDCDAQAAFHRAEQLRLAIGSLAITADGGLVAVTCSFGINWTLGNGHEVNDLLRGADAALYNAKEAGRNRVEISERAIGNSEPREALIEVS